jgi:hypothetical protein
VSKGKFDRDAAAARVKLKLLSRNKFQAHVIGEPKLINTHISARHTKGRSLKGAELESRKRELLKNAYQYESSDDFKLERFYQTPEWKLLRYDALRLQGARCQCCGASRENGAQIVVDHIKPIRTHWALRLSLDNLQVLCEPCNAGKGARYSDDWR